MHRRNSAHFAVLYTSEPGRVLEERIKPEFCINDSGTRFDPNARKLSVLANSDKVDQKTHFSVHGMFQRLREASRSRGPRED